jgi:Spy/CpxP family protein refolding chaperone
MNPDTRKKARVWLSLVFAMGLAIGSMFGYNLAHRSYAAGRPTAPSEPERRAARVMEMTKDLGLTPEQAQKMDAILHAAHDEMKTIHEKSDADVDAVREKARAQMRGVLTAEQMPKFAAFIQKRDEERKKQQAPR